ncbi:MAG: tRNA pseudouridine(38-40) synthase TruA [Pirellulales bacterium]
MSIDPSTSDDNFGDDDLLDDSGLLEDVVELDCDQAEQGRPGQASADSARKSFLLTIAYDGSSYCGWQYQPKQKSVQETLEKGLGRVFGQPVRTLASSRTDAGVHALAQTAVIRVTGWNAPADRIPLALNCYLPSSVVVREVRQVPNSFHPLRDSVGKRYIYRIYNSRKDDPIGNRTHWWVKRRVKLCQMQEAAKLLVGTHDFMSLQTNGSPRSSTIRTIHSLEISSQSHMDGQLITLSVQANGFLYNMMRNIAGTLVQVGVGRKGPEWINEVLAAKDRQFAGQTAPPQGLCLMEVYFRDGALDLV